MTLFGLERSASKRGQEMNPFHMLRLQSFSVRNEQVHTRGSGTRQLDRIRWTKTAIAAQSPKVRGRLDVERYEKCIMESSI